MQVDGARLFVSLTDGRSATRQAVARHDLDEFQEIVTGLDSDADAPRALFRLGFPGAVGEFLRRSPTRLLYLQLAPSLDLWPWESASDGSVPLGVKFRLARQLIHDDDPSTAALPEDPRPDGLRVLRVGAVGCGRTGESEWVHVSHAPQARSGGALRSLLDGHDLVWLGTALNVLASLPMDEAAWQRVPGLFVGSLGREGALPRIVRAVCGLGSALVVGPPRALGDEAFNELCRLLAEGLTIGEAVRRMRKAPRCDDLRLYGEAARALTAGGERLPVHDDLRQITVLSFDLVDSTRLLRRLGGERYSELLAAFHARCAGVVRRHGGVSDDPQGDDGIMCYFGFPVANEAAAQRAVRAGLDIVEAVANLGVQVRVGIATGRVAIKSGQPVGMAIHHAARLQAVARPGTVLVSDTTHSLIRHRFKLEAMPFAGSLKGIDSEPPPHFVAADLRDARDRMDGLPGLTPFVGRESELATLKATWEEARHGHARLVLISGEAGIGKSRLVREFRRFLRLQSQDALECRCFPDAAHSAFLALVETLRRVLQLQEHDDDATRLDKIERGLPPGLIVAEAVPLVASLLSVPYESRYPGLESSPDRIRQRTLTTLLRWFRLAAQQAPICLVVEDVQWIDPSTREFLGRLTAQAAGLPLLVIVTLRAESHGNWTPEQPFVSIELRGLPADAARQLVRQASGETVLPTSVVRMLTARSDGVPLFLEESARMAAHVGARDHEQLLRLDVPASLQDLLMARIDSLGPAKSVAQVGAVIGREFPAALLEAVLTHESAPLGLSDPSTQLAALERSGLLLRSGDQSEPRYVFKHALVCDTAYQSLWGRDRQRVHRTVAMVLRERFPALAERQPELLAHHHAEAGLDADALGYWQTAARHAASRSAHDEAITHLTRALALLERQPPDRTRDGIELRLQLMLASLFIAIDGYGADRVERVYARASELCAHLDDRAALVKVDLGLSGYHFMRADFGRAMEITQRAAARAETLGDPTHRLQAIWAEASILFHQGDQTATALALMDECLAGCEGQPHHPGAVQDPGVMCLCYSAWGRWEIGYPDDALRRIDRVLAMASERNHKFSMGEACGFAASVHRFRGDNATALKYAEQAMLICEDGGFAVWLAHAIITRGRLLCELGRHEEGLVQLSEGFAMWVGTGAVVTRPLYLAMHAEGLAFAGRPNEGIALLEQALDVIAKTGERYYAAEVNRLRGLLALQAAASEGRDASAEAEPWLRKALRLSQEQGKRSLALRSATALAQLWAGGNMSAQAIAVLESELAGFSEGFGTRDLRAARTLLLTLNTQWGPS
jgi:class 3 adenylate cyclase/predicted ATPase